MLRTLQPRVVILPEIKGETCYYSRDIDLETRTTLERHICNGAMLVGFCAGAYELCERRVYNPPNSTTKFRNALGDIYVPGMMAYGPMPGHYRPYDRIDHMGGCKPIIIEVQTAEGPVHEPVWYGNGPGFFPKTRQDLPKGIDIIANYIDVEDAPIAACSVPHGNGHILLSGPLPHYAHGPVPSNNYLWRVVSWRMHQHLFARPAPAMIRRPSWIPQ